jgi:hypothetical protein
VSTKVPTRKRFHENLFAGSEKKALSSQFFVHTTANARRFVVLERRQRPATLPKPQWREQKSARALRAETESAFISNKALSSKIPVFA